MVYTRESSVPAKYKDRIKAAFAKANVDYGKFKEVDNSCKCVHGPTDGLCLCVYCEMFFFFFLFGPPPTEPSPKPNLTRPPPHHHPNHNRDLTESPTALRAEFARRLFLTEEQQLQVRWCVFLAVCVSERIAQGPIVVGWATSFSFSFSSTPSHPPTTGGADDGARDGRERHHDGRGGGADGGQGTCVQTTDRTMYRYDPWLI